MPFGMSMDEFRRTSRAARAGDQAAAERIWAGRGTRITRGGRIALGALTLGTGVSIARTGFGSEGVSGGNPLVPTGEGGSLPGVFPETFAATPGGGGDCPGLFNVRIAGRCVDVSDILPGGDPAVTGQVDQAEGPTQEGGFFDTDYDTVNGRYGAGYIPQVTGRVIRRCPRGTVLGKDGVCYDKLARQNREWDPGMRPLLTGGERAAISKAAAAGRRLKAAKTQLRQASKALHSEPSRPSCGKKKK